MALLRWIGEKFVVSLAVAVLLIATAALIPIGIILAKIEQRDHERTARRVRDEPKMLDEMKNRA